MKAGGEVRKVEEEMGKRRASVSVESEMRLKISLYCDKKRRKQ